MPFLRKLLDPGGRLLVRHLGRLCQSLQDLGVRLRDSIAAAVGQSAGSAVQEAVGTLLAQRGNDSGTAWPRQQRHRYPEDGWHDNRSFENRRWPDDADYLYDRPHEEEGWDPEPTEPAGTSSSPRRPWLGAVAVCLQAAAWWLQQRAGPFSLLTALGCGVIAILVACGSGPLAVTGASLLSLISLVQAGAEAVSLFTQ